MKLNRREGALLAFVVLAWASTPLILFYGLPQFATHTGPIMILGLLIGSAAIVRLLFAVARRLDAECRLRLEAEGFTVIPLGPELLPSWIPLEHRHLPKPRFDGFSAGKGPGGYQCDRPGIRTTLYAYSVYRGKLGFTVARFESPQWAWPEFSCAVGSRFFDGIYPISSWKRVDVPEDRTFSESCWLQTPEPTAVSRLFQPEMRELVLQHRTFRIHAAGSVLMLYSDRYRLIPGEAEAFLDQAGRLASQLASCLL